MEMNVIIFRTLFFYGFVAILYRVMGKRELGQLSIFDLIVSLMIAELIAMSIDNTNEPIWNAVVPIVLLAVLQISIAIILLKNKSIRDLFEGKPTMIVKDGKIDIKAMKKQRYNLDDFYLQMRQEKIVDISDVQYAILETNGQLSIFQYAENPRKTFPMPIIVDGDFMTYALEVLNLKEQDILDYLRKENVSKKDIFILYFRNNGYVYIKRD